MTWPPWVCRIWPYLGRRQAEADVEEELRLHLQLEHERQRDAGLPEGDALRRARRTLGNATLIRERTREIWGWRWVDDVGRDLRHAARGLRRSPGFAATVVVVLALGIGANTAMFSIVYGMLLRPLPYPDSEAIVRLGAMRPGSVNSPLFVPNTMMPAILEESDSFEQLAAFLETSYEWSSPDGVVTLRGTAVSPALFPLLRASPQMGRLFVEEEARAGANRVVLLSHGAWTARFGSDPGIVGAVLLLDDTPHTVVGVLDAGFYFPNPHVELWTPLVIPTFTPPTPGQAGQEDRVFTILALRVLGRLRAEVSREQAAAEVRTVLLRSSDDLTRRIFQMWPGGGAAGDAPEIDARVVSLQEELVGTYRPALAALTVATTLILLIACTNVAGLLLARGVTRRRALAVSAALGAGRGRLIRQLLTESVMLSLGGGALGLAVAVVVLRAAPALVPGDVARLHEVSVDGVVLAFAFGVSVAVGLVFGAMPALQWSRHALLCALNEGSTRSAGGLRLLRSNRLRALLATSQLALALVLLVGAGLLLRSFVGLVTVDRGYDAANVIAAAIRHPDLSLRPTGMTPEMAAGLGTASRQFAEALLDGAARMVRLPGVAAVGVSSGLPLATTTGVSLSVRVDVPGRSEATDPTPASVRLASPGYFDVMRVRLRAGRLYTSRDGAGSPRVVVVNETFARQNFGGEPAVGQRVRFMSTGDEPWEVIGVVGDIRYEGLGTTESPAEAFFSTHQIEAAPALLGLAAPYLAIRTNGDPFAAIPFLREAVAEAHPRATAVDVMTMDARLSAAVAQPRFYAVIVGFFAAVALLLATFGVYGLLSYVVAQRQGEFGIRMALGARRGDVLALVLRQGAALVSGGIAVGLLAAAATSGLLESFLFGVSTGDRLTFTAVPVVLIAVALFACWLPAQRATRVDPMQVLRLE